MPHIMGTAGHVDHGKTSLIRALTGVDCDRLEEEKRRGITIELGFARCTLPAGPGRPALDVGVVDVPGHERFVKNMVAGAAGMDFVLFVIAADEGIMPQTREHLDICSLLGLRHGVVALTKADTVDAEWLDMVTAEVRSWLCGTFLEEAAVVPVSSVSGQGLEELKNELASLAATIDAHRRADLFRLPVDRVFTLKGHGTVATGTAASGSVAVGDDIRVYPRELVTKARALQSHGGPVERAFAGSRTAVNLQGLDVEDLERGDVLAHPGTLFPSQRWITRLTCLPGSPRGIRHRTELHVHHMTAEVLGRFYFYDRDVLEPGESCVAELRLPRPLAGLADDPFVVRAFSPLRTIAGGVILHPLGVPLRRKDADLTQRLALLGSLPEFAPEARITALLSFAGEKGLSFAQLRVLANLDSKTLEKHLQQMASRGAAICFDRDERVYIGEETFNALANACLEQAAKLHARDPIRPGFARAELAAGWSAGSPPKLVHAVFERLLKSGGLAPEGDALRLGGHRVTLAADQNRLKDALVALYVKAGTTPPNLNEALETLAVAPKEAAPVLQLLVSSHELAKVNEALYFSRAAIQTIKDSLLDWFKDHESVNLSEFKDITKGLSRKYLIPLLEYFDRERLTMRVGEVRKPRAAGKA